MRSCRVIVLTAMLTGGAGAIHLAAAVPHFGDSFALGLGFVAIGWGQLAVAGWLLRSDRPLPAATAVAINAAALLAWGLSRTVGLPVGHAGPEAVGLADSLTVLLEVLAITTAVWVRAGSVRVAPEGGHATVAGAPTVLAVAVAGLALASSAIGTASLATGDHHHEEPGQTTAAAGAQGHGGSAGELMASGPPLAAVSLHERLETLLGAWSVHRHADASLHLHDPARVHVHADGTVHLHRTLKAAGVRSADPAPAPGKHDGEAPDQDVHTHSDGSSHTH